MPTEQDVEDAWQSGYKTASDEADVTVEEKDNFIATQTDIILRLMELLDRTRMWDAVPSDLREELRLYV